MTTVKIKSNSKQAKAIIEMLRTFSFVEVVDEKSPYNPEFVEKIKGLKKEESLQK